MKRNLAFSISLFSLLFTHCGEANNEATLNCGITPDLMRAEQSCGAMRQSQMVELCDSQMRHIPICDKTCVEFTSTNSSRVTYECIANAPILSTGKCNYRNTWSPGLFN
jgi:hypothetical protein